MRQVFTKKYITLLISIVAFILLIVSAYGIGFRSDASTVTYANIRNVAFDTNASYPTVAYNLMVAGIVFFALGVVGLAVSAFLGRAFFFLDRILWGVSLLAVFLGFLLALSSEIHFAINVHDFTKYFKQGVFAAMIICTTVPPLLTVGMGVSSFTRETV